MNPSTMHAPVVSRRLRRLIIVAAAATVAAIAGACSVLAGEIRIGWDANPQEERVIGYRVYRETIPGLQLLAITPDLRAQITGHTIEETVHVSAVNDLGLEGATSQLTLRRVTLVIESSPDLAVWTALRTIHFYQLHSTRRFYRLHLIAK